MNKDLKNRIVITGVGLVTPLGWGAAPTWERLRRGQSGIKPAKAGFPVNAVASVKGWAPRKKLGYDRAVSLAVSAAKEALKNARFTVTPENKFRIGSVIGLSKGTLLTVLTQHGNFVDGLPVDGNRFVQAFAGTGSAVAKQLGIEGPAWSPAAACATGLVALLQGVEAVRSGQADGMLAGSSEASICPLVAAAFDCMGALDRTEDKKIGERCRPFDKGRSGFVLGEGAGVLMVERFEAARDRGVEPLAEIVGGAWGTDAWHMVRSSPTGEHLAAIIELALAKAEIGPDQIDFVYAHGTGTLEGDLAEAAGIGRVFGKRFSQVPVTSTKGATGHLLGGAGGVEAALTALAIRDGFIPGTINCTEPDPECGLNIVAPPGRKASVRNVLKISAGFGGVNAVVVLRKLGDFSSDFTD
jgi:3-oxoacyl-[acyl-carrier-protein] synthase II